MQGFHNILNIKKKIRSFNQKKLVNNIPEIQLGSIYLFLLTSQCLDLQ